MMMTTRRASKISQAIFGILVVLFIPIALCSRIASLRGLDIGINYGRIGSNLPPPEAIPSLINSLSIKHAKTFDLDPRITKSFAGTGISLSLCIPNHKIPILASNFSETESIIKDFILPYHKNTIITSISVGNEVSLLPEFSSDLLPAMVNVQRAIRRYRLHCKIKVSTTHSMEILAPGFPPSTSVFQESIAEPVLRPMLKFLRRTNSPFMVNLYPYLAYKESPSSIPLEFALFQPRNRANYHYTDPNNGLVYTNLFDLMVDSVNSAIRSLGFWEFPLVVSETGWPTAGDPEDGAASPENARVFNQWLTKHVTGEGTPQFPGTRVPTYIFSLFDEDQKTGSTIEKHWGVLFANGSKKYDLRPSPIRALYGKSQQQVFSKRIAGQ